MKTKLLALLFLCPLLTISAGEILFLLEKGFNRQEFYELYLPLKALGYDIDIASTNEGTVFMRKEGTPDKRGRDVVANTAMRDVKDVSAYKALVIPGGYSQAFWNQMRMRSVLRKPFMKTPVSLRLRFVMDPGSS